MKRDMLDNERSSAISQDEGLKKNYLYLIDLDYGLVFIT